MLFAYVYKEQVRIPQSYPVQRNIESRRWNEYLSCKAAGTDGVNSGNYRVYLPAWAEGTYTLEPGRIYGDTTKANPDAAPVRDRIRPKMPLLGDANEF